jgi:hypothetical protein
MLTGLGLIAAGAGILWCARAAHEVTGEVSRWATREEWRSFPRIRRLLLSFEPVGTVAGTVLGVAVGVAAIAFGIVLVIRG